ncbi:hypothetical protein PY479_05190 [Shewanella sp. A32]|uniref:hypothetical protein n=1 Tax=Shewanella sp. A32 TaxID=3031327 RepID=UPI0023B9CCFC|nr:hypothetical protein [Shewanella sp. A32]MDF0533674.1 hypothetical protein [Shewanella sp. A32]
MNKNMRDEKDDIFSSLKWLIVVSIILSVIFLGFYWYNVSLPVNNHISDKNDDWSAFASIVGACGSLIAAFGTIGVIGISIKQFRYQQEQIDKQDSRWEKEFEVLNFNKYMNHIDSFEQYLKKIEIETNGRLYSNKKNKIYKSIFENNNFYTCSYELNENEIFKPGKKNYAKLYDNIIDMINRCEDFELYNIINIFQHFMSSYGFIFEKSSQPGDLIINGNDTKFGVFSIYKKHLVLRYYIQQSLLFGRCDTSFENLKIINIKSMQSVIKKTIELINSDNKECSIQDNNFNCIYYVLKLILHLYEFNFVYKSKYNDITLKFANLVTLDPEEYNEPIFLREICYAAKQSIDENKSRIKKESEIKELYSCIDNIKSSVQRISHIDFD